MKHTLIIPTYNRPELLERLVHYYAGRTVPMTLLVLDSSTPANADRNSRMLASYGKLARHIVFAETEQVGVKLFKGLEQVNTPFVSFCADDDIVFPQGLSDAILFLEHHPDYGCAHGLYLNFRVGPQESEKQALQADRKARGLTDDELRQAEAEDAKHLHVWREYGGPGNDAAHAGARIFRLFQNYESLFYAVFRTPDLRDIFAAVQTIPTLHYQELFQSVAALIKGKVWRFPRIYAVRQSCDPAEPTRDKWQTYYWFGDNAEEFLRHYRAYTGEVCKFYEKHAVAPRLDRSAFLKALDLSHTVYFSKGCPPDYFYSLLQPLWPGDGYVQPGQVDLFAQLGAPPEVMPAVAPAGGAASGYPRKWSLRWIYLATRYVLQASKSAPYIFRLNRQVKKARRTEWRLHLPWSVRWLARIPAFRGAYFELCIYLDGPDPAPTVNDKS